MKRKIFTFLLIVCPLLLKSQTFSGKVFDNASRHPVEAVSVSILNADNIALCFTIGEDDGRFKITCENDIKTAKYIHIARLGYKTKVLELENFKNGSQIFLTKGEIALKEVIVKYQPINQLGDTLNYDARGFRLAQDRHIKDILKRLPGIEVEDNGRIKYEGKEINKFYVENMDLTDGKYNIISNNLKAKTVKTVQIFEKHQPISALRGVDFSDQAALNLVLEDDVKGKLLGVIDLGVGFEGELDDAIWENRIISLLFGQKLQGINLYKNANNGMDIKEDLMDFRTGNTAMQSNVLQSEPDIFNPLDVSSNTGFKKKRYFFNNTHFVSTNTLSQLSKDKQLRIQASYMHEKDKQRSENFTTYFLPDATISVTENIKIKDIANQIEGRITYDSNSEKTYLKNTLNISSLFSSNNGTFTGTENVQQNTDLDKLNVSNEFSFIHKFNKDKVFRITSINAFNRLPQKIAILPGLYEQLTGDSIVNEPMVQNATLNSFKSHSFTSFSHPLAIFSVDYNLGLNLKTQLLKSAPDNTTSGLLGLYSDSLSNHYRFTETNLYLSPTLKFHREYIKLALIFNTSLKHLYRHDFLRDNTKNSNTIFLIEPTFKLNYDIDAYWKLGFTTRYSKNYADIHSLYSGYILKSYRNALNFDDNLTYSAVLNNSLNLNYKHPIIGLFINLSGSYSLRKKNNLTQTSFNGIFQQSSNIKINITNDSFSAHFNISKTLPFWSSVADLKYYLLNSDQSQFLSEKLTKNNTIIHYTNLSFTVAPTQKFNIEGGVNFTFRQLKTVSPEKKEYTPIKDYKFDLGLNYLPNKKLVFSLNNDLYHNNIENSSFAFFSDYSMSFLFKNSEIQLIVSNIFNETKYKKNSYGVFSESYNLSYLRERQILIKYSFAI